MDKTFLRSLLLALPATTLLLGCMPEDDDSKSDKEALSTTEPFIQAETRLTAEESEKFIAEDDQSVPVALAGNSTGDTLKAYLTQNLFHRSEHHYRGYEIAEDGAADSVATPMMAETGAQSKAADESAPTASVDINAGGASTDFSGTNTQEKGVDEGDIWKYDGENFFVLTRSTRSYYHPMIEPAVMPEPMIDEVVDVNSEEPTEDVHEGDASASSDNHEGSNDGVNEKDIAATSDAIDPSYCYDCKPPEEKNASLRIVTNAKETLSTTDLGDLRADEIYLADKQLVLIGNKRESKGDWSNFSHWQQGNVNINVMDVTDLKAPKMGLTIELEGHKLRSRRVDDSLYVASRFSPYIDQVRYYPYKNEDFEANKKAVEGLAVDALLPSITVNGTKKLLITPDQCWLTVMPEKQWGSPTLTLVTKININTGEYQSTCLGGDAQGMYMSQNALYLYNTSYMHFADTGRVGIAWHWEGGNTHIHKFMLSDLSYKGSQLVDGVVGYEHASFRFGELKDGSLGVVTTKHEEKGPDHRLTVINEIDDKWSIKAMLPNETLTAPIGKPNERIYSVRFMQDRAYIVTFDRIDPLYVIDLADPAKPRIAGELEIPGFSNYLHPIGSDKLLGVGKEAAVNKYGNTIDLGVKVSLFDVADISQPKEVGAIAIGKRGSSTALSHNHLAFTGIQQEDAYRFAFPVQVHEGLGNQTQHDNPDHAWHDWLHTGLYMFEVKDNALSLSGALITEQKSAEKEYGSYGECRGLIQGDQVYHLKNNQLYKALWTEPKAFEGPF